MFVSCEIVACEEVSLQYVLCIFSSQWDIMKRNFDSSVCLVKADFDFEEDHSFVLFG